MYLMLEIIILLLFYYYLGLLPFDLYIERKRCMVFDEKIFFFSTLIWA